LTHENQNQKNRSNQKKQAIWDAVVVGAGISGLRVAVGLQRAGKRVVVLEARRRIGGRLRSRRTAGDGLVDLGATWVWPTEPRVTALMEELGVSTFPHDEEGTTVYETPRELYRHPALFAGRPPLRVVGGTSTLAEGLSRQLAEGTVRLKAPVTAVIHEEAGWFRIETKAGDEFLARHVVLALPPALAVAHIRFEPSLPADLARLAASTPVWMGNVIKTVVVYDRRFWKEGGFSGAAMSQLGPLQEIHDLSGPGGEPATLFGFSNGQLGAPAPTEAAVLQQLERLFGAEAARPLEVIVQDWRGAKNTSPPEVEKLTDYDLFGHQAYAEPAFGGTLHWSSCETSSESGSAGHIEDALAGADRAVEAILATGDSLKPLNTL